jgi:Lrp/AsnC family leucine-responsive transcriptional regulator
LVVFGVFVDKTDQFILQELQRDARQSAAQIGEKVGLSPSPCARRIRQLEEKGYISQIVARLDPQLLGYQMTVFVHVRLSQHQETVVLEFEEAVNGMPEVLNCSTVSGAFDYLMEVVVKDLNQYEQWVKRLQRLSMVNQLDSSFAIRKVKHNSPLPVN